MNSGLVGALGAAPLRVTGLTRRIVTTNPNANVNVLQLQATGGSKNVDLVLTPKGTGAFILGPPPDGTATAGNKRGDGAVDLQLGHHESVRVASGSYSLTAGFSNAASGAQSVAIGLYNNASAANSIAMGYLNTCTASHSVALGHATVASGQDSLVWGRNNNTSGGQSLIGGQNVSSSAPYSFAIGEYISIAAAARYGFAVGVNTSVNRYGQYAMSSGGFAANGDAQKTSFVLRNKTTNTTPTALFLNGSNLRLTIASGSILSGTINILGSRSDGIVVDRYLRQFTLKNISGTTSLVGSVVTLGTDETSGTSISITADDTNDALNIQVTGISAETWRWVATVEAIEMAYGT